MSELNGFLSICKHNSDADGHYKFFTTYEEAVNDVHEHFLSYDFEMRDDKPYDSGNDSGRIGDNGGFSCFDCVEVHNGKIAGYSHAGGDGPVGEIIEL